MELNPVTDRRLTACATAQPKDQDNLNYIYRFCPYRAVNTLRPSYKYRPVNTAQGNNRFVLTSTQITNTFFGHNAEMFKVKLGGTFCNHWGLRKNVHCGELLL
jgi:hypothetical protein